MELSAFKRNTATIEAGQWIGDIPGMGALRLKVRGMGSKLYQTAFSRIARTIPKDQRQRDGSLDLETSVRVMGEALHEAVLLDWEGVTQDEKPIPFDGELAKTLLTDTQFRPFADAVVWCAGIVDNGRAALTEDMAKNLKPSSAGN